MKRILYTVASSALLALPFVSSAAGLAEPSGDGGEVKILLRNILEFTNKTLIPFIIGIGFLTFVWGMFQYFIAGGANDEAKEKGKSLMIYATLGFVLIIVFWGVVNLVVSGVFGNPDAQVDNVPNVKTI